MVSLGVGVLQRSREDKVLTVKDPLKRNIACGSPLHHYCEQTPDEELEGWGEAQPAKC